jgi:hypothetical protein
MSGGRGIGSGTGSKNTGFPIGGTEMMTAGGV